MDEKDTNKNSTNLTNPNSTETKVTGVVDTPTASAVPDSIQSESTPLISPAGETGDVSTTPAETTETNTTSPAASPLMKILTAAAVIALLGTLWFALESRGVVSTGLFSGNTYVALVNGTPIKQSDFDSGVMQRMQMLAMQGQGTTTAEADEALRQEVLDTLINGELLRQAAVAAGFTADQMTVDARFNEIRDGIGGAEALATRMREVGISEATLRRDIANDILIQQYIESVIDYTQMEVDEAEVVALYEAQGGEAAGLPPLLEVRDQAIAMLRSQKEQAQVLAIVEDLRAEAQIEIK